MNLNDAQSHEIQNEIDLVMDIIRASPLESETALKKLESIRDSIPCTCGNENIEDIEEKYTLGKVFHASSIAREQMSENQMDSDDLNDSEFQGLVSEILGYHWDFKTYDKRLEIVTTEKSAIYAKIKNMSGMQGGQNENEILDGICKNTLGDQPMFDELESYLVPETHEAEIMEELGS